MNPFFFEINQTLFATLLTLVVLCVVFNDNNFIFRILSEIISQTKDEIKQLTLKYAQKDIIHTTEYSAMKGFRDSVEPKTPEANDLRNRCYLWSFNFNHTDFEKEIKQSEEKKEEIYGKIDSIANCNEPNLAAVYCFLYSLLIILIDGLVPSFKPSEATIKFLNSFVFLLSIFSIIFWILVWSRYFFPKRSFGVEYPRKSPRDCGAWHKVLYVFLQLRPFYKSSILLVVYIILSFVLWIILRNNIHGFWNILLCLISFLTIIIAFFWISHRCKVGCYYYSLPFTHFLIFILISGILSWLGLDLFENASIPYIGAVSSLMIGVIAILFTVLNGLLAPMIFPYIKYNKLYNEARSIVAKHKVKLMKKEDRLFNKLEELCLEINKLNDE